MKYIQVEISGDINAPVAYQCIDGGAVVEYRDADGNVIDLEDAVVEMRVTNKKPPTPGWANA